MASDALASARSDPEIAGQLAERAVALVDGAVLGDFEYEEWAQASRRSVDQQLIGLLDLLSVQAEDVATCRWHRRSPSAPCGSTATRTRAYVRLAELLTLQGRSAAAVAVLEDAAEVARELGATLPNAAKRRRDELIRRAADG